MFTTHYDLIQALDLKTIAPVQNLRDDSRTTIRAMEMLNFIHSCAGERQPTAYLPHQGRITTAILPATRMRDAHPPATLTALQAGRKVTIHVFEDHSAILSIPGPGMGQSLIVPWAFRILPTYEDADDVLISLDRNMRPVMFTYDASGDNSTGIGHGDLLTRNAGPNERPEARRLRKAFQTRLRQDMLAVDKAFDDALPIATGSGWPSDSLSGNAAAAPFASHNPRAENSEELKGIARMIAAAIAYEQTSNSLIHVQIRGYNVLPDGTAQGFLIAAGDGLPSSKRYDRICASFQKYLEKFFSIDELICQKKGEPQNLYVHTARSGEFSNHEMIEALKIMQDADSAGE